MVTSPWDKFDNTDKTEITKSLIIADLARSSQQELDAIDDYQERAKIARSSGDNVTADLYQHIISEEQDHFREFTQRIRELGGSPGTTTNR